MKNFFMTCSLAFACFSILAVGQSLADTSVSVKIGGMSCSSCEEKVTKSLMKIPGVTAVKADAKSGLTTITTKEKSAVSMDAIKAAVKEAGFQVDG